MKPRKSLVPKNEKGGAACIFKICCCGGQVFGKYRFESLTREKSYVKIKSEIVNK